MRYMYNTVNLPKDKILLSEIDSAAGRLFEKLAILDVDRLNISDYNKLYIKNYISGLTSNLQKYSYILSLSLSHFKDTYDKFVLVDYGGGTGILSLLAKELGIGTVIYNDIYNVSCADAYILASSIGNVADYYVQGDTDDLAAFLTENKINCNAIASYDVIEHVYRMETFFSKIVRLSQVPFCIVMASGSNKYNPINVRRMKKVQIINEYEDREKKYGHKERDCLKSYLRVRKEIIENYLKSINTIISEAELNTLSKNTRGLMTHDIHAYVEEYIRTGKLSSKPDHPTNTCDPLTGNWSEHIFDPYVYKDIFMGAGFEFNVLGGPISNSNKFFINHLNTLLNFFIGRTKYGMIISPFITIYCYPKFFSGSNL